MAAKSTSSITSTELPAILPIAKQSKPKLSKETVFELPPETESEMANHPLLDYSLVREDVSELKSPQKTAEGELLDDLLPAGGEAMTIETSINQYKESRHGIRRFRKLARMVKANLVWSRDMQYELEEDSNTFAVNSDGKRLTFNVDNFKVTKKIYGELSPRVLQTLIKHPTERTPADIWVLKDIVSRLECFHKYSAAVRKELARIVFFDCINDGRVVIQQGHIGVSFYFIISGTVHVKYTDVNKVTGEKRTIFLGELSKGSSFGEMALMHDIRRTATIVCKGDCQFLRVDKGDFEEVLGKVSKGDYQRRYDFLQQLTPFRDWTPLELVSCNSHCRIVDFPPDKIIQGPDNMNKKLGGVVCYIVNGECAFVRSLLLRRESRPDGETKLHLPTQDQLTDCHNHMATNQEGWREHISARGLEHHMWSICSFKRNNYFGVGENLKDTYIVSKTKLEVLLVPKSYFTKVGLSKMIDEMKENISRYLPTNKVLYNTYLTDLKWRKYKDKTVREVLSRRHVKTNTSLHDVPMSIRISNRRADFIKHH